MIRYQLAEQLKDKETLFDARIVLSDSAISDRVFASIKDHYVLPKAVPCKNPPTAASDIDTEISDNDKSNESNFLFAPAGDFAFESTHAWNVAHTNELRLKAIVEERWKERISKNLNWFRSERTVVLILERITKVLYVLWTHNEGIMIDLYGGKAMWQVIKRH